MVVIQPNIQAGTATVKPKGIKPNWKGTSITEDGRHLEAAAWNKATKTGEHIGKPFLGISIQVGKEVHNLCLWPNE